MTPQEVAMKLASASATCKNGKCPYTSECRGTGETCKMKEIAMMIRALTVELAAMKAKYDTLDGIARYSIDYMRALEDINERYYRLCVAFQNGSRPKPKIKRKKPRKKRLTKAELLRRDGDERYAYEEPPKPKKELPVVII